MFSSWVPLFIYIQQKTHTYYIFVFLSALVNKGNILYRQQNYERARDCYAESLQDDSSCVEALYNLGLVCKRLERYEEAIDAFFKLHNVLRNSAPVIYQIMDIYDKLEDHSQSQEW